jgi:hypothetical protein
MPPRWPFFSHALKCAMKSFGASAVAGVLVGSSFSQEAKQPIGPSTVGRFQMVDRGYRVFDTMTGRYWTAYENSNTGEEGWDAHPAPWESNQKPPEQR